MSSRRLESINFMPHTLTELKTLTSDIGRLILARLVTIVTEPFPHCVANERIVIDTATHAVRYTLSESRLIVQSCAIGMLSAQYPILRVGQSIFK